MGQSRERFGKRETAVNIPLAVKEVFGRRMPMHLSEGVVFIIYDSYSTCFLPKVHLILIKKKKKKMSIWLLLFDLFFLLREICSFKKL